MESLHTFVTSSEFVNCISALTTMRRDLRDAQLHILAFYPVYHDILMHIMSLTHEIDSYLEYLLNLHEIYN